MRRGDFVLMKTAILFFVLCFGVSAIESGVQIHTTPSGTRYGTLNEIGSSQPVLFNFALDIDTTLSPINSYNEIGRELISQGWLIVSLDLPSHGMNIWPGEPGGLLGWRYRIEHGYDIMTEFCGQASDVLSVLISSGAVNPNMVYSTGTSRGGFMALQFCDVDSRVKGCAAFCPVSRLDALSEFIGFSGSPNPSAVSAMYLTQSRWRLSTKKLRIYSGPDDQRVGTLHTVEFVRMVNTVNTEADLQMVIKPSVGHNTPSGSHVAAANWIKSL